MKKRIAYITSVIIVLSLIFVLCSRNNDATPPILTATIPSCETFAPPACETFAPPDVGGTQTLRETAFHESDTPKNVSKTAIPITIDSVAPETVDVATTLAPAGDGNYLAISGIDVAMIMSGCNLNTPNWGESLGTVSFYTSEEWRITCMMGIITQIWSDAVTATACQKTTFDGGTMDRLNPANSNFNADCRSNPDFPGDFFSWCAVVRFAEQLCPYPWRVPTTQDFRDLDIALGGTGQSRSDDRHFVATAYINRWGGVFAGCTRYGRLSPGSFNCYWSITEHNTNYAFNLIYSRSGGVRPQDTHRKTHGLAVRCVR